MFAALPVVMILLIVIWSLTLRTKVIGAVGEPLIVALSDTWFYPLHLTSINNYELSLVFIVLSVFCLYDCCP